MWGVVDFFVRLASRRVCAFNVSHAGGQEENTMFETLDEEMRKEADRKTTYLKAGLFVAGVFVLGVVLYFFAFGTR